MPLTPFTSKCYHPLYAHARCPGDHPVHLDVDHYEDARWVHCLLVDLVECPHEMEDASGAALPGRHRGAPKPSTTIAWEKQ